MVHRRSQSCKNKRQYRSRAALGTSDCGHVLCAGSQMPLRASQGFKRGVDSKPLRTKNVIRSRAYTGTRVCVGGNSPIKSNVRSIILSKRSLEWLSSNWWELDLQFPAHVAGGPYQDLKIPLACTGATTLSRFPVGNPDR